MAPETNGLKNVGDFEIRRFHVDLDSGSVRDERLPCQDMEDVLGGIARGYKILEDRMVADPYAPEATLLLNLGSLSGTDFMTGLRTFFMAFSPLKRAPNGHPSSMWTAGSGKFGTKLRYLGIDDVLFTGACPKPSFLHITTGDDGAPRFALEDAADLAGKTVNQKIQALHGRYPDAHFAVLGPAAENFRTVRFAAIALSTENQLRSGDPKARFCGRGGIGGVMGSKNLLAIVADIKDPKRPPSPEVMKTVNGEVARGKGSQYYREPDKGNGNGGTWANYAAMQPLGALPERNFSPTGTDASVPLFRSNMEEGPYVVKDEACYRCGIRCHKNVYDQGEDGKAAGFRAKLDYEPLNLLSSNIGIYEPDQALELVELVDELGMDSISLGATLGYAMEYNERHPDATAPLAGGLRYGDFEAVRTIIQQIGTGRCEEIGQGTLRLSEQAGEPDYAMHCKGVEFPAYLPQTNPGYPWALAGGHMSMRTYLLLVFERETGIDYWVDAICKWGWRYIRDDVIGICKFSGVSNNPVVDSLQALHQLAVDKNQLTAAVRRTFLRGYRLERREGFGPEDYRMPAECHAEHPHIDLPYFNTPEFFEDLRGRVISRFDEMLAADGLA